MTTATLLKVEEVARGIPEPKDYFAGVDPVPELLPTNVLQFYRRESAHLSSGPSQAMHHRFVLISNLGASGCVILDGSVMRIEPGEGVLVFPFQSHHFARFKDDQSVNWLFTTFEYERAPELESLRDIVFTYENRELQRLRSLTEAFVTYKAGHVNSGKAVPLRLALVLNGLLHRQQDYLQVAGGNSVADPFAVPFLQPVSLYIHRNLSRQIHSEEIAAQVHLSVSRLRSKFRQITGISIGRFITETRMNKARSLLYSTDLNVTQIAESCGFASLYSFSRAFRRIAGRSPSDFRKNVRQVRGKKG